MLDEQEGSIQDRKTLHYWYSGTLRILGLTKMELRKYFLEK